MSDTIDISTLSRFCLDLTHAGDPRWGVFVAPFSVGDCTYATDKVIIIRVPRIDAVPVSERGAKLIEKLQIPSDLGPDLIPWPAVQEIPMGPCTECDGGDGILCTSFSGEEYIVDASKCRVCKGSGKEIDSDRPHVVIADRKFDPVLTNLVATLGDGITCVPIQWATGSRPKRRGVPAWRRAWILTALNVQ